MKEKLIKFKILQLQKTESKKYSEIFVEFVELFKKYFEKQALFYIASLDNLEILEKNDFEKDFLKKLEELLEKIYNLWVSENFEEFSKNLQSYWYEVPENIILDNKEAIEYAKNHAWELILWINQTTKNQIWDIISKWLEEKLSINEIALKIKEKFDNYSTYRASLIAQNETALAYSSASRKQNDSFTKKLWVEGWKRAVTQKDSNVRQSHLINESDWWIPKNQVYSWTWSDKAPFGIFCRCHDEYSLVNPETGLLYDIPEDIKENGGYTDEQIDYFHKWNFLEKFMPLNEKNLKLKEKYWYTDEEIMIIENWSWNSYKIFTNWFKNNWFFKLDSENEAKRKTFNSWIKFLFWFLRKTPNFSWTVYRWHKCYTDEYNFLKSLKVWDIYNNSAFFSSSLSKETAKNFVSESREVVFTINTKKAKSIMDFSTKPAEQELLFFPNTLFKVDKIENKDNILEIYLSDL